MGTRPDECVGFRDHASLYPADVLSPATRALGDDRDRVLIEELGDSEEIVAALPADDPDPRAPQ